jgi:hypothetical protein
MAGGWEGWGRVKRRREWASHPGWARAPRPISRADLASVADSDLRRRLPGKAPRSPRVDASWLRRSTSGVVACADERFNAPANLSQLESNNRLRGNFAVQ